MDSLYRILVPLTLWLGIAAFVLGIIMMLAGRQFLFGLTPGGIINGAQTLLLVAVGSYCARRTGQRA